MRIRDYAAAARGSAVREKLLIGLTAGLLLCSIAEGVALIRDRRAVVIVPEGLSREARLSASKADEPYLSSWSYYLAGLLGNVTPGTSGYIKDALGPRLAPEVYQSVISALSEQVRRISEDRVSLSFIPKYSKFEERTGKYFVNGISVMTGPGGASERTERTYEFRFRMRNFQPYLTWIETYEGSPRTLDEIAREERRASSVRRKEAEEAERERLSREIERREEEAGR